MRALLISPDTQLYAEIASQGAARVPPLHLASTRSSLRDALDRLDADSPQLVIIDASETEPLPVHRPSSRTRFAVRYSSSVISPRAKRIRSSSKASPVG